MAKAIGELVTTFRSFAVHLGIASEPYARRQGRAESRDAPGFG